MLNLKYLQDSHAKRGHDVYGKADFDVYRAAGILYVNVLTDNIIRQRVIHGWKIGVEDMVGTIYLEHDNYPFVVWCTPFWEDSEGIDIAIQPEGGEANPLATLPFNITGDVNADTALFVSIMTKFLVEKIER